MAWRSSGVPAGSSLANALRPVRADETRVQVHARAGHAGERLRHEAGDAAVTARDAADRALEEHRFVDGAQRVGAMLERDLELPRRVLRHQRAHRQALRTGRGVQVVEERRHVVEPPEPVGVDVAPATRR